MNKAQRKHYDQIAKLGCILCRHLGYSDSPAEIHHVRKFGGKRDLAPVIPLCPEHHRGNTGVHGLGKKGFRTRYSLDEQDLVELTEKALSESPSALLVDNKF
jgi:hypothetical protein